MAKPTKKSKYYTGVRDYRVHATATEKDVSFTIAIKARGIKPRTYGPIPWTQIPVHIVDLTRKLQRDYGAVVGDMDRLMEEAAKAIQEVAPPQQRRPGMCAWREIEMVAVDLVSDLLI